MAANIYLSIITPNVNGLNVPIKSWMGKKIRWIHKLCVKDPVQIERHIQSESKGVKKKKIIHANGNNRKLE